MRPVKHSSFFLFSAFPLFFPMAREQQWSLLDCINHWNTRWDSQHESIYIFINRQQNFRGILEKWTHGQQIEMLQNHAVFQWGRIPSAVRLIEAVNEREYLANHSWIYSENQANVHNGRSRSSGKSNVLIPRRALLMRLKRTAPTENEDVTGVVKGRPTPHSHLWADV